MSGARTCGDVRNVRARSRSVVLSSPELVDGGLTDSSPCEGVGEAGLLSSSGMGGFKRISTMASQSLPHLPPYKVVVTVCGYGHK